MSQALYSVATNPSFTAQNEPLRDLEICKALLKNGSRSFYAASFLLPAAVRNPAMALYAFCRLADDAVDNGGGSPAVITILSYKSLKNDLSAPRHLLTVWCITNVWEGNVGRSPARAGAAVTAAMAVRIIRVFMACLSWVCAGFGDAPRKRLVGPGSTGPGSAFSPPKPS